MQSRDGGMPAWASAAFSCLAKSDSRDTLPDTLIAI
jgi:hypothetical protein